MRISNWPLTRRLSLAFAGAIAIFLTVIGVAIKSQGELEKADAMNQHTYVVLGVGQDMLQSMVNMETGARGFLLSGEDRFLEPWTSGIKSFDTAWNDAKSLTADNPVQQRRLDDMRVRNAEFVSIVGEMQKLRRDVNSGTVRLDDFIAEFRKGRDKAAMDGFRALQAEFSKMERDLLTVRSAAVNKARVTTLTLEIGGSVLALIVAALLGL